MVRTAINVLLLAATLGSASAALAQEFQESPYIRHTAGSQRLGSQALQSDPTALLGRIQDLERRLAQDERMIRQLEAKFESHNHQYPVAPASRLCHMAITLGNVLAHPDAYRNELMCFPDNRALPPAPTHYSVTGPAHFGDAQ